MRKASRKPDAIFAVAEEMIKGNGEDCLYYEAAEDSFILCSFDGCGGSGAKKYANYSGKTGAYIASRAVCGGVMSWFRESRDPDTISQYVHKALGVCKALADKTGMMMGSLSKAFPTTASIIFGTPSSKGVEVTCFWAGDSRCYLLDANGLHQLTEDDLDNQDAMSNLTSDGVMTNVINGSTSFEIHQKTFPITQPCVFLTATDGCFGYLNSPMEFEHLLLDSLQSSRNILEWKESLYKRMFDVAGDDFTLCAAVYGFKEFELLRRSLAPRADVLAKNYLIPDGNPQIMWESYKKDYSIYL